MSTKKGEFLSQKIVILGTGGTIAGLSLVPGTGGAYKAAQVDVQTLVTQAEQAEQADAGASLSPNSSLTRPVLLTEQLAQVDSKDMTEVIWQRLLRRVAQLQQDPDVQGIVITHGTDTLEETGFLLHACWPHGKPVVLTCAMRAADAPDADGPRNLRDAISLASTPDLTGVRMVCDGLVFEGHVFQKVRTDGVQPFGAEPIGAIGECRNAAYIPLQAPDLTRAYRTLTPAELEGLWVTSSWPRVEIVMNHVGADGWWVQQLLMVSASSPAHERLRGIVVAGTGGGSCSERLTAALLQAQAQGILVWRSTRATWGTVRSGSKDRLTGVPWSPAKARVAMMLDLLIGREGAAS
jgi:L-asparaginase